MRKVTDINFNKRSGFLRGETDTLIHYEGCGLIGSHTLCGYTDIIGSNFAPTNKRVTCRGCLAVQAHVLGKETP